MRWPNTLNELAKFRVRARKPGRYDVMKMQRGADRGLDDGRVAGFLAAVWKKPKLFVRRGPCVDEPVHGGNLRS